jgi:hypothetical protein
MPSLADFTTTTPELKFSVHTGVCGHQIEPMTATDQNSKLRKDVSVQHGTTRKIAQSRVPRFNWPM